MGASLRLAGPHHARRADRVARVGAHLAARRVGFGARSAAARRDRTGVAWSPAMARDAPLLRFALRVLAWLPIAFAVWYFAAPLLLSPAQWMIRAIAQL